MTCAHSPDLLLALALAFPRYSDKNENGEWTPELQAACKWDGDKDDGLFWMCSEDFVRNLRAVNYARSFGVAWKKVTQWISADTEFRLVRGIPTPDRVIPVKQYTMTPLCR